jgi:two-component system KDP operon response regulator KdpE
MTQATSGPLVLIIDDEAPIRRFLRASLESHGYRVKESSTGGDGLMQARSQRPDLILLDLGLPDGDGIDITRVIRTESTTPIIVVSARGQEQDKIAALDAGADDYLTKPFGVGELAARLRVALRHASRPQGAVTPAYESTIEDRTLHVNIEDRIVKLTDHAGTHPVKLTLTEFKLLAFFVKHAGKVLTHQQILRDVWGPTHAKDLQYLRVYAAQLRQKIEAQPAQPQFLITEAGIGYRLAAPDEASK